MSGSEPDKILKEQIEQQNKYNNIRLDDFLPAIFRYIVLIILYFFTIIYFSRPPSQFILTIIMLILNFFTVVFLFKDFLSTPNLAKGIMGESFSLDIISEKSIFTKLFVFAIFITLTLNFATISIMIYVFDYGNKNSNNNTIYKMSSYNTNLMNNFIVWFKWYMMIIGAFAFIIVYSHSVGRIKILLQNLVGFGLSITVIVISSYLCSLSVDFLKHKYNLYT